MKAMSTAMMAKASSIQRSAEVQNVTSYYFNMAPQASNPFPTISNVIQQGNYSYPNANNRHSTAIPSGNNGNNTEDEQPTYFDLHWTW